MSELTMTIFLLLLLFALLGSGIWVAFSLMTVGIIGMMFFTEAPLGEVLATTVWGASNSWSLAALPLFIWMGEILFRSKLSEDMFAGLSPWLTHIPGRLLHVNILGCGIFAAVSGSSAATAATIGKMSIPELAKRDYPENMLIGTLLDYAGSYVSPKFLCNSLYEEKIGDDPAPAKLRVLVQRCRAILENRTDDRVKITIRRNTGWKISKKHRLILEKIIAEDG